MIPSLPQDKANHFFYGSLIGLAFYAAAVKSTPAAAWIALIAVSIIAVGKEAKDAWINYKATGNYKVGPHGVEFWDAVATIAGGAIVTITAVLK